MKDKYNVENKKINFPSASPLDRLLYERFGYLFASIAKIHEMPHGVDKGIHTIHRDIDVVNFYDENESVFKIQKVFICLVIETFVIEFWVVSPSYNYIY
jgi:hypothetical protein